MSKSELKRVAVMDGKPIDYYDAIVILSELVKWIEDTYSGNKEYGPNEELINRAKRVISGG